MAKITMADGSTFEGTISEWVELSKVAASEAPTQVTRPIISYDELAVGMTLKYVAEGCSTFTENREYKVVDTDEDGDFVVLDDDGVTYNVSTYHVYDEGDNFVIVGEAPKQAEDAPLKVGDYVRIIGGKTAVQNLTIGNIVEIESCAMAFDFRVKRVTDGEKELFDAEDLVKATDAEVAAAKAPKFSVGDYVRPMSAGRFGGVDIVALGEISNGPDRDGEYRVDALDGSDHDYFMPAQLERVTDADKAAAQESVAEAERWDEIGRKVNEFKAGDIVRYLGGASTNGQLREVSQVPQVGFVKLVAGPYGVTTERVSNVELLTPVEDRFDRA
ncbi:hypothetical protein [uncultured Planococcus sp.]|uniref:hypothetical protein n=1 Tax=uncultured Planococcus sp. TaxID=337815 RepID=UPI0026304FC7|nr:hypothetical protein [uncultured Planococcus sp.]